MNQPRAENRAYIDLASKKKNMRRTKSKPKKILHLLLLFELASAATATACSCCCCFSFLLLTWTANEMQKNDASRWIHSFVYRERVCVDPFHQLWLEDYGYMCVGGTFPIEIHWIVCWLYVFCCCCLVHCPFISHHIHPNGLTTQMKWEEFIMHKWSILWVNILMRKKMVYKNSIRCLVTFSFRFWTKWWKLPIIKIFDSKAKEERKKTMEKLNQKKYTMFLYIEEEIHRLNRKLYLTYQ